MTTTGVLGRPPCQEAKLNAVRDAACAVFPRHYRPDSCIAAARVLVDAFDRLHVRVRPLSVTVDVFNPAMVARASAEGGRVPETDEEYQRWVEESGCWWLTLGIGDPEPGKWPGHVTVVAWDRVLIDLTLPQASRPQRGIVLAPAAIQVWAEVLTGAERRVVTMHGCELHYRARPQDRSFMGSRDWQCRDRHKEVVSEIVRRARDELGRRRIA
jgi:hypothetical protein